MTLDTHVTLALLQDLLMAPLLAEDLFSPSIINTI